jgi:hypothetical protein
MPPHRLVSDTTRIVVLLLLLLPLLPILDRRKRDSRERRLGIGVYRPAEHRWRREE